MAWVSVRRCLGVYVCARACCCGAFLMAYRLSVHRTRVSLAFFAIWSLRGSPVRVFVDNSVTLHRSIHPVVASPSSSSNGLHRTRRLGKVH